jgi:hypothetical protein
MSNAMPFLLLFYLLAPSLSKAQDLGQVECARPGDYVYLYSSMITLNVRATLECGQQVEITGRYDNYFGVRTAKAETGYVPLDSLLLLKTTPGAKPTLPPTKEPTREKTFYDQPTKSAEPRSNATELAKTLILPDSTPIRMKLDKAISSADAKVGDEVSLEVSEGVIIDGLLIIPKGASAMGVINEAEPKKALGRGGKLGVLVRSVRLANNDQAVLRSGGEGKGSSSTAGVLIPVMHGKDITFPKEWKSRRTSTATHASNAKASTPPQKFQTPRPAAQFQTSIILSRTARHSQPTSGQFRLNARKI